MNLIEYPSDEVLKAGYQQIEAEAIAVINEEGVGGNLLLKDFFRGNRWSISTGGYVFNSPAGIFLTKAMEQIRVANPSLQGVPSEFLHLTFTELVYNNQAYKDKGVPNYRKAIGVSPEDVMSYYNVLFNGFDRKFDPIRLCLYRLFPTLDAKLEGEKKRTGTLVAAFLTDGDTTVFQVKDEIVRTVQEAGIGFSTQYGTPAKVLLVTLGRFIDPPNPEVLLPLLTDLNKQIGSGYRTDIRDIKIISTSPLDYKSPRGHIEIWPPIALNEEDQILANTKFLTPSKRIRYHQIQRMLMGTDL